jgi:hypothetical protein
MALIIQLTPRLRQNDMTLIRNYWVSTIHEFAFDVLRCSFFSFIIEDGYQLFIEENKIDHHGRKVSVLEVLEGINKILSNIIEEENHLVEEYQQLITAFWEN